MGDMYWSVEQKTFFLGKFEGDNLSGMSKHVLMDQTLRDVRGHSAIAQIWILILVSSTISLFALKKTLEAWHTSATKYADNNSKKIPNQSKICV